MAKAAAPKKKYIIDWRVEGCIEIEAASPDEAQEIFDRRFTFSINPRCDGAEASNDPPYLKD